MAKLVILYILMKRAALQSAIFVSGVPMEPGWSESLIAHFSHLERTPTEPTEFMETLPGHNDRRGAQVNRFRHQEESSSRFSDINILPDNSADMNLDLKLGLPPQSGQREGYYLDTSTLASKRSRWGYGHEYPQAIGLPSRTAQSSDVGYTDNTMAGVAPLTLDLFDRMSFHNGLGLSDHNGKAIDIGTQVSTNFCKDTSIPLA